MTNQLELAFDVNSIGHLGVPVTFLRTKSNCVSILIWDFFYLSSAFKMSSNSLAGCTGPFSLTSPQRPLAPMHRPQETPHSFPSTLCFDVALGLPRTSLLSRIFLSPFCKLSVAFSTPQYSSFVMFPWFHMAKSVPSLPCSHRLLFLALLKLLVVWHRLHIYAIACCGYYDCVHHNYGQAFAYSFNTFIDCLLCVVSVVGKWIHRI